MSSTALSRCLEVLREEDLHVRRGRVTGLIGLVIEASGLRAEVGELCTIAAGRNADPIAAEVVGFRERATLLMPFGSMQGIGPGNQVSPSGASLRVGVGEDLLGRIVDGLGQPIDDLPAPRAEEQRSTVSLPPRPFVAPASTSGSRSVCGRSTASSPAAWASASASSRARASGSRRYSG